MKKAKLFLSAIAVVAVVGSAMAYTKTLELAYCVAPLNTTTPCTTILDDVTQEDAEPATHRGYLKPTPDGVPCPSNPVSCPEIRLISQGS
jgi:hypothetical protein